MIRNWKERTDRLRNVMEEAVASGEECGCQLVVYEDGERVVDLCAGFAAPDRRIPIRNDALFPIFSVGKGVMATAFHRLVEQGKIAYDTRIADIWPEFGCNGKEKMLVWHILTHRGALFDLPLIFPRAKASRIWRTGGKWPTGWRMPRRNGPPEQSAAIIRSHTHGCWAKSRTGRMDGRFRRFSGRR